MKRIFGKKGVTLIELLVAMAILSIVLVMVGSFMVTGTNLFSTENSKAKVQNEVQLTLNRISDVLKASQLGVSYSTENDGLEEFCIADSGDDVDAKYLYVFNWNNDSVSICASIIKWVKEDAKMYMASNVMINNTDDVIEMDIVEAIPKSSVTWDLLAEHIDGFSVDLSNYELKKTVDITISSKRQKGEYENTLTTALRNNVLLNASSVGELYDLAERAVTTVVEEISLTAARNTTIPGGQVQLTTFVSGQGYPSQRIYKWKIVKLSGGEETEVIYDSLTLTESDTNISSNGKLLNVSDDMEATILRIYAYANTYSSNREYVETTVKDRSQIEEVTTSGGAVSTLLIYDYKDVAIRNISTFEIKPVPDMDVPANESLKLLHNDFLAIVTTSPDDMPLPGIMDVYPGNVIPMKVTVEGGNLTPEDKEVYWTIDSQTPNTDVVLDTDGTLVIGKYSADGQILVSCHSVLDSRMCLSYYVNIGDAFAEGRNMLEIVGSSTANRGGSVQLGLKLNENTVDHTDLANFNWNFEVVNTDNERVPGTPATLSDTGLLAVSASVNYDYAYNVNLTVSMKNNPSIRATKRIAIPRVKITLSSDSYVSKRGRTIDYGEITANVTGVEKNCYTLSWDLASETNPNQFQSSYANGTNISGNNNNSCRIFISGSEPESLTYLRARVKINGHTTHFALARIVLADVSFTISSDKNEIPRSNNVSVITFTASSPQASIFTASELKWEIVSAKIGDTEIPVDGLVLRTTAGGAKLYAEPDFYLSTERIAVTVRATWSGIRAEKIVYITPVNFTITGPTDIKRGGTVNLSVNNTNGSDIIWSVSASDGSSAASVTQSGIQNKNAAVSLTAGFLGTNTENDTLTVTATVSGSTLSAKYTLKVLPVTVTVTSAGTNKYTATITGADATGYEWALKTSEDGTGQSSITGVTMSTSGNTVTLTIGSSPPNTFWLSVKALDDGALIGNAEGQKKITRYQLSTNPSGLRYEDAKYTCQYDYISGRYGSRGYYSKAIRGYKTTSNSVEYWKTNEGTYDREDEKMRYSGDSVYYARVDGSWYKATSTQSWSGRYQTVTWTWTELDQDSDIVNRLEHMRNKQNID